MTAMNQTTSVFSAKQIISAQHCKLSDLSFAVFHGYILTCVDDAYIKAHLHFGILLSNAAYNLECLSHSAVFNQ